MSVFLFISDIASYIGQNYFDPTKSFERLWKKVDKEGIQTVCENILIDISNLENEINKLAGKKETRKVTNELIRLERKKTELELALDNFNFSQVNVLKKEFGELLTKIENENLSIEEKKEEVACYLERSETTDSNKKLNSENKNYFKDSFNSFISKSHGVKRENLSILKYEEKFGVKLDVSQKMFKKEIYNSKSGTLYILCGKMDGLDNSGKVIEVKNRTNGFFNSVRDYELTQMQLYLFLTGYSVCELVEDFNGQIKVTHIERDDSYISQILNKIKEFLDNFENFLNLHVDFKKEYIIGNLQFKKKFLSDHLLGKTENKCLL